MIDFVTGKISELTPTAAVIETSGGIGFRLEISLPVYTALQGKQHARLLVHEAIREDAWTFYGFLDERERAMFRNLIAVSGVGTATARLILSSIPAPELEKVIVSGSYVRLKEVKGIGMKTAQRIIIDLKGKIELTEADDLALSLPVTDIDGNEKFEESLAALTMLGFTRQQSYKALKTIFGREPAISIEAAIRQALAMLH